MATTQNLAKGMTADYSHGGPEWDARLRDAVTRLEKGYVLVDGLADERPAAMVIGANYVKTGEPAGTRTQGPRLKSSKRPKSQWLDFAKVSPFFL
jgi:hypothetical protein